ncbi:hypothetical protein [Achromobacter phage SE2]|nr:hypothetical protein [Achromobacter phage SE2]
MLYWLEQDQDQIEFIKEQCRIHGRPLPERIANAPELWPGLELYQLAFNRLNTGRVPGFSGPRALSWMDIEEYCDRVKVFGPDRDIMHHHMKAMDAAFLKAAKAKQPKPPGVKNDKAVNQR